MAPFPSSPTPLLLNQQAATRSDQEMSLLLEIECGRGLEPKNCVYLRFPSAIRNHTIAWRVDVAGYSLVFTGDFNNQKNQVARFAKNVDAFVVTHAIPEISRGKLRDTYVLPSQIGRIAKQANARMVILGHRTNRTKGRESQSRQSIEKHYQEDIIFADDMECWGL